MKSKLSAILLMMFALPTWAQDIPREFQGEWFWWQWEKGHEQTITPAFNPPILPSGRSGICQ